MSNPSPPLRAGLVALGLGLVSSALGCSQDSPSPWEPGYDAGPLTGGADAASGIGSLDATVNATGVPTVSTRRDGGAAPADVPGRDAAAAGDAAPVAPDTGVTSPMDPKALLGDGFYHMEHLDRGLIAVTTPGGVYVGFRAMGPEHTLMTEGRLQYQLLRNGSPVADLTESTNHLDPEGNATSRYQVRVSLEGAPGPLSAEVTPLAAPYLRIPLSPPRGGYTANDASAADLDGDGSYDLVLKWEPDNAKDNSQAGVTSNVFLDGLTLAGEHLWRIDLGPNIRAGAHYTQFVVYDLDSDGHAEIAVKTAPGSRDGTGQFLSMGPAASDDDSAVYRNGEGYILRGPEYLTVFDGATGAERATVEFDQARGDVGAWGDGYGNRVDRFLATAAYLDDTGMPSVVMARGYYTRTTLTAYNFRDGALVKLWKFDSDVTPRDARGNPFGGQGCHSLSVANVDDDLPQEIIYGAMSVDHDGRGLCSTGFGHGDALHVSDFDPARPGLESFMPHESSGQPAWSVRDARTCEVIQRGAYTDADVGRGVAADVLADNPGSELWASGGTPFTSLNTGRAVGGSAPSINFLAYWDADDTRELLDGTRITEADGRVLLECGDCASNNGTKATPTLVADLLGDYREEVVWREADSRALRLYTTTDLSSRYLYTLMHDPQYRVAISFQNVAYNQPPHPSFLLSAPQVPVPNVRLVSAQAP